MLPHHIVLATVPHSFTDEEFSRELDELARLLRAAAQPLALLIVLGPGVHVGMSNRETAKRFFETEKGWLRTKISRGAVVTDNKAIRAAVAAAGFIGLFPFSAKAFSDPHKARAWLCQR
jgi:hypothetical protein